MSEGAGRAPRLPPPGDSHTGRSLPLRGPTHLRSPAPLASPQDFPRRAEQFWGMGSAPTRGSAGPRTPPLTSPGRPAPPLALRGSARRGSAAAAAAAARAALHLPPWPSRAPSARRSRDIRYIVGIPFAPRDPAAPASFHSPPGAFQRGEGLPGREGPARPPGPRRRGRLPSLRPADPRRARPSVYLQVVRSDTSSPHKTHGAPQQLLAGFWRERGTASTC